MKSISDHLSVTSKSFENTGAFNAILGVDSKLFVDPPLVYNSDIPEFYNSKQKIHRYFESIMLLMRTSKEKYDKCWNNAIRLLTIPEIKGISIGYSTTKGNGNGIGKELAKQIVKDANKISELAKKDTYFFELLGLFEKNIGSDRISDLIIHILKNEFTKYTERIFNDLDKNYEKDSILPSGDKMILVPTTFLSNLPHGELTFKNEITDERVRNYFNTEIGNSWKDAFTKQNDNFTKDEVLTTFLENPEIFDSFIHHYLDTQAYSYDFIKDPEGEVVWYETTKKVMEDNVEKFAYYKKIFIDVEKDILEKALVMCKIFKELVENNKLGNLFYKENYQDPKKEDAIQLTFYGVCHFFSVVHDLDLTPESNTGRGPVDFKVSHGTNKVLIEVKKTLHSKLEQGYFVQLEEYKKSEKTEAAIFLVIVLEGDTSEKNLKDFKDKVANTPISDRKSEIVYVDARKKKSASKY